MLDTFAPLGLSQAARDVSDADYPWSWAGGRVALCVSEHDLYGRAR